MCIRDSAKQRLLLICRKSIEAGFKILRFLLVVDLSVATTLLHIGHPSSDNPEQVRACPNHHDQHKHRLSSNTGGEALQACSVESDISDSSKQENAEADQQNFAAGQINSLPDR